MGHSYAAFCFVFRLSSGFAEFCCILTCQLAEMDNLRSVSHLSVVFCCQHIQCYCLGCVSVSGVTIGRARRAVHAGPALWGAQNLPDAVF